MKRLCFAKKYFYCLLLFLCIMSLTGCGKELSSEEAFCKTLLSSIKKYQHSKISYDTFLKSANADYDKYCSDADNIICIAVRNMNYSNTLDLEPEDCSDANKKDVCEAKNMIKRIKTTNKEADQKNAINNLKKKCNSI